MWSLEPTFFDEHGALVSDLPDLEPEDAAAWLSTSTAFPTLSIAASLKGVARQSVMAAERYGRLHKLEEKYPGWMLLRAVLAEVHYLLFDKAGSLQRLLNVQAGIGRGKDEQLERAVLELAKLMEEEDEADEEAEVEEGMQVAYYKRAQPFSSVPSVPWSIHEIRQKWQALEQTKTEAALAEFGRYAAVSTNVLEGVFSVDGHSMSRLVKRGFYVNSIEGISATSRIKKKAKIVQILENTQSCLRYLTRSSTLDEPTIQALHRTLMEGNDLSQEIDDDDQVYVSLVPSGSYRRVPCYTTNGNLETRYCPWRQVPVEMQWFFEEAARAMADDSADPFLISAWLHLAFLSIHPFADGNGRVGRMISSVPLVKAGLPPVVVYFERKEKYFAALIEARESGDMLPLASFLREEVELGIIHISNLDDV